MDRYKRFYGLIIFIVIVAVAGYLVFNFVYPLNDKITSLETQVTSQTKKLENLNGQKKRVEEKLKKLVDSNQKTQKKIFAPVENDLGDDTLFFTLYNDVIEMIHSNSVKIKKMDYVYNPDNDLFVQHGNAQYFVCDINLELVSNYVNLGKLIQNIYQYPYYVKINSVEVNPYKKDKKILLTNMSLRLYAHTEPVIEEEIAPAKTNKK